MAWAAFRDTLLRMEGAAGQVLIEVRGQLARAPLIDYRAGPPKVARLPLQLLGSAADTSARACRRPSWRRCGARSFRASPPRLGQRRRRLLGRCWCAQAGPAARNLPC